MTAVLPEMAVASYRVGGQQLTMRHFHVPKRAGELKYWYAAARKAIPALPKWEPRFGEGADITVETIILGWAPHHQLIIARKRQLV